MMTVDDVIRLSKAGLTDDVIIQQMSENDLVKRRQPAGRSAAVALQWPCYGQKREVPPFSPCTSAIGKAKHSQLAGGPWQLSLTLHSASRST